MHTGKPTNDIKGRYLNISKKQKEYKTIGQKVQLEKQLNEMLWYALIPFFYAFLKGKGQRMFTKMRVATNNSLKNKRS